MRHDADQSQPDAIGVYEGELERPFAVLTDSGEHITIAEYDDGALARLDADPPRALDA